MKFGNLSEDDYDQMLIWEEYEKQPAQNKQNNQRRHHPQKIQRIQSPLLNEQILINPSEDQNQKQQNNFQHMLQAQHKTKPIQNNWMKQQQQQQQQMNNFIQNQKDYFVPEPPALFKPNLFPPPQQPLPQKIVITEQLNNPMLSQQQKLPCHPLSFQKIQNMFEQPLQKKSQTMEICSACNQPKEKNHQCDGEYGFILCPFCGDSVVRNFMKDHQEDCIPYLESQFKNIDNKGEECQICYVEMINNLSTQKCNHTFHTKCIGEWKVKSKECPICRGRI